MANSKQKGNTWEYEFADILTAKFGRNFKRSTQGSGAMFGGKNFHLKLKGRDTSQVLAGLGDIVPPTGYYVVSECKNYAEFDFYKLLQGKETILWDWIEEVRHDSRFSPDTEEVHLPHWLAFKVTRRGSYLALPHKFFSGIFKTPEISPSYYLHKHHKKVNGVLTFIDYYYIINIEHLDQIVQGLHEVISNPIYFKDDVTTLV